MTLLGNGVRRKLAWFGRIRNGGQRVVDERTRQELAKVACPHAQGRDIAPLEYLHAVAETFVVDKKECFVFAVVDLRYDNGSPQRAAELIQAERVGKLVPAVLK